MLFDKKTEPSCAYCVYGDSLGENETVCVKRGIVETSGSCRHFRYAPMKRKPPRPVKLRDGDYSESDFSL